MWHLKYFYFLITICSIQINYTNWYSIGDGNHEMKITKISDPFSNVFLFPPGDSKSHDDYQNQQRDNDGYNKAWAYFTAAGYRQGTALCRLVFAIIVCCGRFRSMVWNIMFSILSACVIFKFVHYPLLQQYRNIYYTEAEESKVQLLTLNLVNTLDLKQNMTLTKWTNSKFKWL